MNADGIFIAVRLALGVDGGHGNHGGVQRIDALMWCPPGMRCLAEKANMFGDDTVVRAAVGDLAVCGLAGGVRHHGEIDVIKGAQTDKLRLAAKKF